MGYDRSDPRSILPEPGSNAAGATSAGGLRTRASSSWPRWFSSPATSKLGFWFSMDPREIAREDFMRILYWLGIPWRLYRCYQRGGSARWLSMFIGQSIKFWRDFL